MVYFAYYTELNFASTRKNDAFVAKIVNTRSTKLFMAIFALAERLPTSATLPKTALTTEAPTVPINENVGENHFYF